MVRNSDIVAGSDRLSVFGGDCGFQDGVAKGGQRMASLRELQELRKATGRDEPLKLIRTFNIGFMDAYLPSNGITACCF